MRATRAVLLATVLLVTGCAAGAPPSTAPPPTPGTPPPLLTGSPPAPAAEPAVPGGSPTTAFPGAAGQFNGTDTAWLQLTVAMAERLLPMLALVPNRATDPSWERLTARIEATERTHLTRSRRLLADSGAPAANPHEGHDMPGMVTDAELTALRSVTGRAFNQLLAGHLRAHLTQAVRIAKAERQGGAHPATTALAAAVVRAGTADLARLDQLDTASQYRQAEVAQPARRDRATATTPTTTAISPTTSAT
ncbi:DUF305 domain-containing protein [Micromonospora andamanensis]|uniref:DUF305 domain-containing protein n=1 Tax=Micromonospora andamanensis TaxID=1287068 RepID=A0ABQ4I0W7_9ACTN|nr:DUF305 domain-containing protein [Micromonospora andamanensis]GIJ11517.1 hypothetical protein Van01_47310 [Micromonospora andamanensis]